MLKDGNKGETIETMSIIDFSRYIEEKTRDFAGRDWVFTETDRWLADPDLGRVFLLTGGPGSCKTAVAARLAQVSLGHEPPDAPTHLGKGQLVYFHFFQAQIDATVYPLRFVESLSAGLASRYPPFANALLKTSHREINVIQNVAAMTER